RARYASVCQRVPQREDVEPRGHLPAGEGVLSLLQVLDTTGQGLDVVGRRALPGRDDTGRRGAERHHQGQHDTENVRAHRIPPAVASPASWWAWSSPK